MRAYIPIPLLGSIGEMSNAARNRVGASDGPGLDGDSVVWLIASLVILILGAAVVAGYSQWKAGRDIRIARRFAKTAATQGRRLMGEGGVSADRMQRSGSARGR